MACSLQPQEHITAAACRRERERERETGVMGRETERRHGRTKVKNVKEGEWDTIISNATLKHHFHIVMCAYVPLYQSFKKKKTLCKLQFL